VYCEILRAKTLWEKGLSEFEASKKIVIHVSRWKLISKFPENLPTALKQLSELILIGSIARENIRRYGFSPAFDPNWLFVKQLIFQAIN
jgi:hypothetical protein